MTRRMRPYIDYLEGAGIRVLEVSPTGSTHQKIMVTSRGKRRFFIVSSSPSDHRSFENWKSDVRKWLRQIRS